MRCSNARWAVLALILACRTEPQREAAAVAVRVVHATRRSVIETLSAAGTLVPPSGADVKLGALVAGRLSELPVAVGDLVGKGQLLAQIEATPYRDALAQAVAQLTQTRVQHDNDRRKLERAEKLVGAGISAKQEVGDARAQEAVSAAAAQVAAAAVSTARNQLERTELRSPFAGEVAHVFAAPGEPVDGSGKPIVEVAHTELLELQASVPSAQANRLVPGLTAEIRVGGLERRWASEVIAVAPLLSETGTAVVRLRVPNRDLALKGGEVAQAEIFLATHADALAVPESALVPAEQSGGAAEAEAASAGAGALAVEVVDARNQVRRQAVRVEARGQGWAAIEGLPAGAPVVVQGAYALPDGAQVKPLEEGAGPLGAAVHSEGTGAVP